MLPLDGDRDGDRDGGCWPLPLDGDSDGETGIETGMEECWLRAGDIGGHQEAQFCCPC